MAQVARTAKAAKVVRTFHQHRREFGMVLADGAKENRHLASKPITRTQRVIAQHSIRDLLVFGNPYVEFSTTGLPFLIASKKLLK